MTGNEYTPGEPNEGEKAVPLPCTLHPAPFTLHPAPCTLHPAPCTLDPGPWTLDPASQRGRASGEKASSPRPPTGVPRSYKNTTPLDPTVGICAGPCGGPREVRLLMGEVLL